MYTLIFSNLDEFEVDHITELFAEYRLKMLSSKLEAITEDLQTGSNLVDWFDRHLIWHDSIMSKVKWTKE